MGSGNDLNIRNQVPLALLSPITSIYLNRCWPRFQPNVVSLGHKVSILIWNRLACYKRDINKYYCTGVTFPLCWIIERTNDSFTRFLLCLSGYTIKVSISKWACGRLWTVARVRISTKWYRWKWMVNQLSCHRWKESSFSIYSGRF